MSINVPLLKLNTVNVTKLVDYSIEYNKLWKDADRNMNGEVRASLIGIFPKIKVKTSTRSRAELAQFANILNYPVITVAYYDMLFGAIKTAKFYASDITVVFKERERELIEEFSFTLIPISKRV